MLSVTQVTDLLPRSRSVSKDSIPALADAKRTLKWHPVILVAKIYLKQMKPTETRTLRELGLRVTAGENSAYR